MAFRFITVTPRHYSRVQLEQKLAVSILNPREALDGPEGFLWEEEAAMLLAENAFLDHVVFVQMSPFSGFPRLKMTYTSGPKKGDVVVAFIRH